MPTVKGKGRPTRIVAQTAIRVQKGTFIPTVRADEGLAWHFTPTSREGDSLDKCPDRMGPASWVEIGGRDTVQSVGLYAHDEHVPETGCRQRPDSIGALGSISIDLNRRPDS